MSKSSSGVNMEHMQMVARHLRADIDRISQDLATRGSRLQANEIYLGLAEVLLRVFIDQEGFDNDKLVKFCEIFNDELRKGMAKAKAKHSFHN